MLFFTKGISYSVYQYVGFLRAGNYLSNRWLAGASGVTASYVRIMFISYR